MLKLSRYGIRAPRRVLAAAVALVACAPLVFAVPAYGPTPGSSREKSQTPIVMRPIADRLSTATLAGDRATSASQGRRPGRPDYSSRAILAVGTLKSYDAATSTVVVAIDRARSNMPHILLVDARRDGLEQKVIDREFPPERAFTLSRRTMILDARASKNLPQARADTGKMLEDPQRIPIAEIAPGDCVGVLYRMNPRPDGPPFVLNFSKLDPDQKDMHVDFNPMRNQKTLPGDKHDDQTTTAPLQPAQASDKP